MYVNVSHMPMVVITGILDVTYNLQVTFPFILHTKQ